MDSGNITDQILFITLIPLISIIIYCQYFSMYEDYLLFMTIIVINHNDAIFIIIYCIVDCFCILAIYSILKSETVRKSIYYMRKDISISKT